MTLTKEQELSILAEDGGQEWLIEQLTKDLKDVFKVEDATFVYGGTDIVGVDGYDSFSYDFVGKANNPDPDGDKFVIKGRYIIAYSEETRFSLAMLGQEEYWDAGVDKGTWEHIVDSLDID